MTKAENRAAAGRKATQVAERGACCRHRDRLAQLAALRKYLLFDMKAGISADSLIEAIDDYVENLTVGGDSTPNIAASDDHVEIHEWPSLRRPGQGRAPHIEIANTIEPAQGKLYIELINYPMLFKASPAECWAGLQRVVERGWLTLHESGTFVKFTPAGADLFA
jgi:hypothetical protein